VNMTTSKQLAAWCGDFGDAYADRNPITPLSTSRKIRDWSRILDCMRGLPPTSILEVGANIGRNIAALRALTDAELFAVEPNARARGRLIAAGLLDADHVFDGTAEHLPFLDGAIDLVFTSGVLIHIAPDNLPAACSEIHRVARSYVLAIEYFSDEPQEKRYRGRQDMLYLRDYGTFWLDSFPDLRVLDFGFFWKHFSGSNINWWLFAK
jgi:pseudaminic acid biosynthesis-associated methylase